MCSLKTGSRSITRLEHQASPGGEQPKEFSGSLILPFHFPRRKVALGAVCCMAPANGVRVAGMVRRVIGRGVTSETWRTHSTG
jgi:hypothetical protein